MEQTEPCSWAAMLNQMRSSKVKHTNLEKQIVNGGGTEKGETAGNAKVNGSPAHPEVNNCRNTWNWSNALWFRSMCSRRQMFTRWKEVSKIWGHFVLSHASGIWLRLEIHIQWKGRVEQGQWGLKKPWVQGRGEKHSKICIQQQLNWACLFHQSSEEHLSQIILCGKIQEHLIFPSIVYNRMFTCKKKTKKKLQVFIMTFPIPIFHKTCPNLKICLRVASLWISLTL